MKHVDTCGNPRTECRQSGETCVRVCVCVCVQEQHTGKQEKHDVYVTVQKTHAGKHVKHVDVRVWQSKNCTQVGG